LATTFVACGGGSDHGGNPGGNDGGGLTGEISLDGGAFNQCGVAAPPPAGTGQCTLVTEPLLTNFDDYASGTAASSYTYYVNPPPGSNAVLGAILHIGDGSDMNGGTSVISTDMVTGDGGAGYALQISDSDALHWGGSLLFYFPSSGATPVCLNAQSYQGLKFSIQGTSPSGKFAVSLGMLDTIPVGSSGLCNSPTASDCVNATVQLSLPSDAAAWAQIMLPWSAFTPGVGNGGLCVPVTGQNIVQIVIQPIMNYPPPNYTFAPGPYTIAVDNVQLY